MAGYRTHLVNVWTEADFASVPVYTMIDSILYLPDGAAPDVTRPAVVFVHGWGRYPYDRLGRELAPQLAEVGVTVLLLAMRRRGGEGQTISPMPDGDLRDIKVAIDALTQHGTFSVLLVGQDVGATSVARYAAVGNDNRVAGIALVDPIADLHRFLVDTAGTERTDAWFRLARQTSYEMKGDLVRIDADLPLPGRRPLWVHQAAGPFLAWWSPDPELRLPYVLERVRVPVLAIGPDAAALEATGVADTRVAEREQLADQVAAWARTTLPRPGRPSTFELVEAVGGEDRDLIGYLHTPEGARDDVAILVVHGLTSGPFSPMVKQFLPHYTDHGFTTLAVETRRSGVRCIADSDPDHDLEDVDAFMALLTARGYDRIVLVGASLGSQAVSRYVAARHHPAVIATVHLAPTGDMAPNSVVNIGPEEYARVTEQARRAVAEGRGDELLVYDLTERGPSRFHSHRRTFWRAESWLTWWGPDANTVHLELIADVDVPVLLVTGTADDYSDQARIDELTAAARSAPSVDAVWVGGDHAMRGAEGEAAEAVVTWLESTGLVAHQEWAGPHPLAGITGRVAAHVYPAPPPSPLLPRSNPS